jgi:hypothetical protein
MCLKVENPRAASFDSADCGNASLFLAEQKRCHLVCTCGILAIKEEATMSNDKKSDGEVDILVVVPLGECKCQETQRSDRSGPKQVATKAFRDGWDVTFGKVTVGNA